jgi:hypothetical protein
MTAAPMPAPNPTSFQPAKNTARGPKPSRTRRGPDRRTAALTPSGSGTASSTGVATTGAVYGPGLWASGRPGQNVVSVQPKIALVPVVMLVPVSCRAMRAPRGIETDPPEWHECSGLVITQPRPVRILPLT